MYHEKQELQPNSKGAAPSLVVARCSTVPHCTARAHKNWALWASGAVRRRQGEYSSVRLPTQS